MTNQGAESARVEICVVGGGRMGEALVAGLIASGVDPATITVAEVAAARRAELSAAHVGLGVSEAPVPCRSSIVAVKPHHVAEAVRAVAAAGAERILSVAAGVTLAALREAAGDGPELVRAMPNTPALVGAGATAICGDADALDWAEGVLAAVGLVVRLDEDKLDAVTGLSGSGPAYVFLVAEAMIEAGVLAGLPRDVAEKLAGQTLLGASRLITEGDRDPSLLRADVTSPGGTTAAGLRMLERAGVRAAFLDAVDAAASRSRELGGR